MSITKEQWEEYKNYLQTLSEDEVEIELQRLIFIGLAKEKNIVLSTIQTNYKH